MVETETKEWHAEAERMKNKKFCIKIRAWVWEYSDENFEKSKLQKEIKKLLTSLGEYAILNKLSREELLHNSKKEMERQMEGDVQPRHSQKHVELMSEYSELRKI